MMKKWLDRKFPFETIDSDYLSILERLEGTPLRLSSKMSGLTREQMNISPDGKWSIAEHAGHLLTIESLWIARLDDFVMKNETLRAWNGTNADTDAANFNAQNPKKIVSDFSDIRLAMVKMLRKFNNKEEEMKAFHPRLQKHVRLLDHVWFIAEHDDHHLASIQQMIETIHAKAD